MTRRLACILVAFAALALSGCGPAPISEATRYPAVLDRARVVVDLAEGEEAMFAAAHSGEGLLYLRVVGGRAPVEGDPLLGDSLSCPEDLSIVVSLTGADRDGEPLPGAPIVGAASDLASGCVRAIYPVPAGELGAVRVRALDGRAAGEILLDVDFVAIVPGPATPQDAR